MLDVLQREYLAINRIASYDDRYVYMYIGKWVNKGGDVFVIYIVFNCEDSGERSTICILALEDNY